MSKQLQNIRPDPMPENIRGMGSAVVETRDQVIIVSGLNDIAADYCEQLIRQLIARDGTTPTHEAIMQLLTDLPEYFTTKGISNGRSLLTHPLFTL